MSRPGLRRPTMQRRLPDKSWRSPDVHRNGLRSVPTPRAGAPRLAGEANFIRPAVAAHLRICAPLPVEEIHVQLDGGQPCTAMITGKGHQPRPGNRPQYPRASPVMSPSPVPHSKLVRSALLVRSVAHHRRSDPTTQNLTAPWHRPPNRDTVPGTSPFPPLPPESTSASAHVVDLDRAAAPVLTDHATQFRELHGMMTLRGADPSMRRIVTGGAYKPLGPPATCRASRPSRL